MVLLCYKILNKAGRCRSSDVRRHFYGKEDFSPRVAPLRGKSCFQSSPVRRWGCLKAGHYKEQFMEIRKVPISLLNAAPYNPRKDLQPGDPEYQKIARSIEKYGCVEPIIWNERTGNVIGGHQRLKVLAATGVRLTHWLHPLRRAAMSTSFPALNPISIISLIPGFRQSPRPRNPLPPLHRKPRHRMQRCTQTLHPHPMRCRQSSPAGKRPSLCLICLNRMQPPSWTFSRTWALRTVWRMRHDTVCDMRTSDGGLSLLAGG